MNHLTDSHRPSPSAFGRAWQTCGVPATLLALSSIVGGSRSEPTSVEPAAADPAGSSAVIDDSDHGHVPGSHGGQIVSLGRDSYHLEAVFEAGGRVRLYTMGADETRVIDIPEQTLAAYAKRADSAAAHKFEIVPDRQPGDAEGRTSSFLGTLPAEVLGPDSTSDGVTITLSNVTIDGERFRATFESSDADHDAGEHGQMPEKVSDDKERDLYLTPGGIYTQADIEANGSMTATERFRGIRSQHDLKPVPGDRICPVTLTKANPSFSWTIGGQEYLFCCPPCVDEFLRQAKEDPESILPPESYVKAAPDGE